MSDSREVSTNDRRAFLKVSLLASGALIVGVGYGIPSRARDFDGGQLADDDPAPAEKHGKNTMTEIDETTKAELEAAVFRRLVAFLRERTDVQNIDLMNLAGFCRNCLSNWYRDAAEERGIELSKEDSREIVYGMPYDEWKARHQTETTPEKLERFEEVRPRDGH